MCKNAVAPMIVMLDHLELDMEVSDTGIETMESDDCRGIKFTNNRLSFPLFYFLFLFLFCFILLFSIFRTPRVRVDWSCCHISHNLMA